MTTASICTIGDEILIGQIVDTNSSRISQELNKLGIKVRYMFSIGDDRKEIIEQLGKCIAETDITIVTGGLGPTKDDITKDALMALTGAHLYRQSEAQYAVVERILSARGIPMLDINKNQALVPDNCSVIVNNLGTAPCMSWHNIGPNKKASLYSLPGVPFEALGLLPDVMEDIKQHFKLETITHKTIVTFGIAESALAKQIEPWEDALPSNIHLAYLPNSTVGVRLRLTQFGGEADFQPYIDSLKKIIGNAIYGEDEDTLQVVIGKMLRERGMTLSVAESCTGGHISELITSISGCSDYYKGSVTSYANEVKINTLGVSAEIIEQFGAVSEQTVRAMAEGVLIHLNTDFAVATSGIAGPGGGSPEKPVGTVWMGVAHRMKDGTVVTDAKVAHFSSNRAVNIERFASAALNFLRLFIVRG